MFIFHEHESFLTFLFISLDGECRIAYSIPLESIENGKFRMRINDTEFCVSLQKETQVTSVDVSNSATKNISIVLLFCGYSFESI